MHTGFRAFLGAFTVLLLGVFPSISPVQNWVQPAQASSEEIDRYFTFDGTDDVATGGFNLTSNTDFSIEMWLYFDGAADGNYGIFRYGDTSDSHKRRVFAYVERDADGNNELTVGINGNESHYTTGYYLPDQEWVHFAVVREDGSNWRVDINGTEVFTRANGYWNIGGNPAPFRIGDQHPTGDHWKGRIDQVKIWDGALTSSEVQTSMSTWDDTGITGKSLLHHYDFNDVSTTQVTDQQGTDDLSWTGSPVAGSFGDVKSQETSGSDTVLVFPRSYLTSVGGWTVPSGVSTLELLTVGGGGGGERDGGGGGGGGESRYTEAYDAGDTSYLAITVGAGGAGGSNSLETAGDGGISKVVDDDGTTVHLAYGGSGAADDDGNDHRGSGGAGGTGGTGGTGSAGGNGGYAAGEQPGETDAERVGYQGAGGYGGPGEDGFASTITGTELRYGGGGGGGVSSFDNTTQRDEWLALGRSLPIASPAGGSGGGGQGATVRASDSPITPSYTGIGSYSGTALTPKCGSDSYFYFATTGFAGADGYGGGGGGGTAYGSICGEGPSDDDGERTAGGAGGSGVVVVSYGLPATPSIDTAPSAASVNATETATFSASASTSDAGTLSYQWEKSTDSGSNWSDISGATSASYTTPAVDVTDSGDQFRVVVRNTLSGNFAETTSSAVSLTVTRISQTVTWSPPSSQTAVELADSGFTINAATTTGDGTISYSPTTGTGDTNCAINNSTRVVTFDSTGTCTLTATAAETDEYASATKTVTITVSRGTFALTAPSSKVGTSSSSFTDVCVSSCVVSGFAAADAVLVIVSKSDGSALAGLVRLDLDDDTGLGDVDGYTETPAGASGYAEIAFQGTQAEVNAALEDLQYKSPSGGGDETIGISATLGGAAYYSGNGHYYEEVDNGSNITWSAARDAAAERTFNGLTGYLVTITSAEENAFVAGKTTVDSWIGATDDVDEIEDSPADESYADQDAAEGNWYWVTGPEAGTRFWIEPSTDQSANDGRQLVDEEQEGVYRYAGWNNSVLGLTGATGKEPNDHPNEGTSGEENFGYMINSSSLWNDYPNSASVSSYVIEYGGNGGTALKEASNTFDVGAPTAPLQVSGVSASAGNGQLTLSWSAPDAGGSAITDYVVEQYDPDTSTWSVLTDGVSTSTSYVVTGLTNGTSYSFRVSAKNAIGTGTVSSTASGTPAVPAAMSTSRNDDDEDEPVVVAPVVTPTVTGPPVRLPVPTATPPAPRVLTAPVATRLAGSTPVNRVLSRVGGVPAPVTTTSSGDDEVSVSTSSMRLSLRMSEPGTVSTASDDVSPELTLKPGARAAVTGSGLLPNTSVQVWLPNVSDRELGRLTVNADGELTGEVSLSSPLGEDPLPIGRQSLQVTGYDADGNQTVVEMPVNIAQGPPTPEPNREVGALPDLTVGQSLATSAGVPTTVAVTPFAEQRIVAVDGGDWSLSVALNDQNGEVGGTNSEPLIRMTQSGQGSVTGDGFQPGTVASLWMFSDPTLLGTVTVAEDGSFNAEFLVDAQFLPVGEHTMQVQGVGTDGYIKAANLGVLIDAAPAVTTADSSMSMILWVFTAAILVALVMVFWIAANRRRQT